ncbi:MAG TPA: glucosamine-6-phosphate deaminase [Petrotogaceae bacterium]|jgi:glucosamine-6-phosphate deaminase|nr:glucosamine-6-phosphate deaminase [Petrotogaceae bacterium]HNY37140.1 glucosamine-6-phosphate deaminase [Petrotogaceae bacterium]HOG33565.1 glucosamine-6-phosphate deaminase [Petrotogaceae bacterium]HPX15352.1 glucosamine-6-phosphate deaminase [Petrotogaceae bacterium]HQC40480.1 glucosamine-6-phosphate deaminase [Petrotogaceae bacterium]
MKILVCKDYEELSRKSAEIIVSQVNQKKDSVLGLATGGTPVGMYQELVKSYREGKVDFGKVITFNLDEYYGVDPKNVNSYHYYMNTNFFDHVNIDRKNINIPNGMSKDIEKECREYDEKIQSLGGIDLQILGVGLNGHIGFNEPARELMSTTHITDLTKETINANARFFEDISQVPTKAITVGMATILRSKKIVVLINGKNKSKIFEKITGKKITTQIPATLLQLHPDVTIVVDEQAAT